MKWVLPRSCADSYPGSGPNTSITGTTPICGYMPGAALAVGGTRNGGQECAINTILGFYHTQGMPVVNGGLGVYAGAAVWSQDRMAEGAAEDEKGMENARAIGRRLALTAKALKAGKPQT